MIGIDVGGTRTKGVALSRTGDILAEDTRPTESVDAAARLGPAIGAQVDALAHQVGGPVAHVGVAVPGLVDEARGLGVWSANLGWRDLDLTATLAPHLPAPVTIGHDVRAGLLGEHRLGAARGQDNVCFVPLGTGIAAALLCRGQIVRGNPWTGEIGHVTVDSNGIDCGCGRQGCLETLVGGAAMARLWKHETGSDGGAAAIAHFVAEGNPVAAGIWMRGITALADVLAPILAANGTDLLVMGGGLSQAGDVLTEPLQLALRERLGAAPLEIVIAQLGDRAGALGAAVLAGDLAWA